MKRVLMAAVCVGILVYGILMLTLGPAGVFAYSILEDEIEKLDQNVRLLGEMADRNALELEALKSERSSIVREAISMGYLGEGDMKIIIEGASSTMDFDGSSVVLRPKEHSPLSDDTCELLAVAFALISLAIGSVLSFEIKSRSASKYHQSSRLHPLGSRTFR
jgi:hypothetical protein